MGNPFQRRQQDKVCGNISEMNSRMQNRLSKVEIVIWVSGRNVMTSPPFRCLYFFKPRQLFPLHQLLVLCGWQRSGGFFLSRGWLLVEKGWHAAAFLKAMHGRRSVPPFVLLNFILLLLLQFSRPLLCCSCFLGLYAKTFHKLMYFGEHQVQPSLVF